MKYATFCLIAGAVFALVALVHLSRIVQGWELVVDGTMIPLWVNWVGLIISGVLAFYGLYLGTRKPLTAI